MALTAAEKFVLIRARVLFGATPAGERLSDFEAETVTAVLNRFEVYGADCPTTPAEFAVVAEAVNVMECALRHAFARLGALYAEPQTALRAA